MKRGSVVRLRRRPAQIGVRKQVVAIVARIATPSVAGVGPLGRRQRNVSQLCNATGVWRPSLRRGAAAFQAMAAVMGLALLPAVDLPPADARVAAVVAVGMAALRIASLDRRLAHSTVLLDAIGSAILLAVTGAGTSPFLLLAPAGVAWAAVAGRGRADLLHALSFSASFTLIGIPIGHAAGTVVSVCLVIGLVMAMALGPRLPGALEVRRRRALMHRVQALPLGITVELPPGVSTPTAAQARAMRWLLAAYSQSSATSTPGAISDSKRPYSASEM